MNSNCKNKSNKDWPEKPQSYPELMTVIEAAMYLRLDELGQTTKQARRNLNYWRERGELKATKFARHVWFLKEELDVFLRNKTEIS